MRDAAGVWPKVTAATAPRMAAWRAAPRIFSIPARLKTTPRRPGAPKAPQGWFLAGKAFKTKKGKAMQVADTESRALKTAHLN